MANSVLAKMAVEISANTAGFNKSLSDTNKKLDSFSKNISGIGKTLIAGFGLYEIGSGIIDVTAKFQKFEAILTNTLGDQSAAQKALRNIEAFAASTPFQVDEVTAAYVRWANQGLDPTIDRMGKLGDIASSLGAGFEQTAEAFKDLMVGQTKRIEEVGISATQANGKIQLSFKGVNIEIEKNAEGVQKALDIYSQLNGVLGTSDAISKTLGGRISNLKDSWDLLLKTIGEANSGPLFTTINVLTRLTQGLAYMGIQAKITMKGLESLSMLEFEKVFSFGETESLKKISDVLKEINAQNSNAFFKDIEENKKKFISLLSQEGESQKDILILWGKYVDLRLKSANDEDAAIAKKKSLVTAIKEETKAVEALTKVKKGDAGEEAISLGVQAGLFDGFGIPKQQDKTAILNQGESEFQTSALDDFYANFPEYTQKTNELSESWLNFANAASDAIARTIEADQSFGKSIASVTGSILNSSKERIAAFLGEGIAKAFSINPFAGLAVATLGLGVVQGLLGKLSKASNQSSFGSSSLYGANRGYAMAVTVRQRGTDLVGVGIEENRMRARTRG
jgi:Tape measure protein